MAVEPEIHPTASLGSTEQPIPLENATKGQVILLKLNFTTDDKDDQSEGESVIIKSSAGDSLIFSSREDPTNQPQLVVTFQ